jgi:adenylate cyclase
LTAAAATPDAGTERGAAWRRFLARRLLGAGGFVRRIAHYGVPLLILAAAIVFRVVLAGPIEEAQLKVFDSYQRLAPRAYVATPVTFLDIDDESLARVGQWPWPRTFVADLIARLHNAGAAAIALDIVFAEPDRTSPANVLPLWPATPEVNALRDRPEALPDHDRVLADIIGQVNVVSGFVLTDEPGQFVPDVKSGFAAAGDDPRMFLPEFHGAVANLPSIGEASAGSGSFNLIPEHDGIIRRVPLLFRLGDDLVPSLAAEALRVAQGARSIVVKSSGASGETAYGEHTGINNVKIGSIVVPTDGHGRMWLHFTPEAPERTVAAWRVFGEDFDAASIAGNIVVVGTSAAGLRDVRATPLNPVEAGALIHVQALEQMLLGHHLKRPDWFFGVEIIYIVLLGITLIVLLPRLGALWCAGVGSVAIAAAIAASWYAFRELRWLLDPIYPSAVVLLIYLSGSLLNYLRTESEKRQIRGAFSQYLSPALVEQLAAHPERLVLGGEMRDMTLLFCDIRGFTTISEQFKEDPQGLTQLINRFLTPMTDMILARRGTIDKYMGDCIMAFWNAPLDDEAHAAHGCDSALAMFTALSGLNEEIKNEREAAGQKFFPINIGIGLNSGECCVGNMGSRQRFDYSVLGDAVNLASRLEGQSKNYGVGVVIGDETRRRAPDYAVLELDLIAVKGKKEAVRIHALLGGPQTARQPWFEALRRNHGEMLEAYRGQQWDRARERIATCRAGMDGFDLSTLYDLYDERIAHYLTDPPPADWDGVFVATSK